MRVVLRQTLLIAAKDMRIFFKDRFAVGFSFLFPFLFVIGFGLALRDVGPGDDPLAVAIASQEAAGISQEIVSAIAQGEDGMTRVEYATALADVEAGQLDGFVAFPPDFTERILSGERADLDVVVASDADPGVRAALIGVAQSIAGDMSTAGMIASTLFELSESVGGPVPFDPEFAAWGQPQIAYEVERVGDVRPANPSNFTLPAYLTMFVFFAASMSAQAIAREREGRTLERLMSNGARRESIALGKFAGALFVGLAQLAVMWTVGLLAFGIDLGLSPAAVILVSALMALASAAFGVMLGCFVRSERAATTAGVLVSLTLAPIGGCWWPLFVTPEWMQSLARLTPHGWANGGFNKLMLFGATFGDVSQEMIALAAFGAVFLAVALWRFRVSPG